MSQVSSHLKTIQSHEIQQQSKRSTRQKTENNKKENQTGTTATEIAAKSKLVKEEVQSARATRAAKKIVVENVASSKPIPVKPVPDKRTTRSSKIVAQQPEKNEFEVKKAAGKASKAKLPTAATAETRGKKSSDKEVDENRTETLEENPTTRACVVLVKRYRAAISNEEAPATENEPKKRGQIKNTFPAQPLVKEFSVVNERKHEVSSVKQKPATKEIQSQNRRKKNFSLPKDVEKSQSVAPSVSPKSLELPKRNTRATRKKTENAEILGESSAVQAAKPGFPEDLKIAPPPAKPAKQEKLKVAPKKPSKAKTAPLKSVKAEAINEQQSKRAMRKDFKEVEEEKWSKPTNDVKMQKSQFIEALSLKVKQVEPPSSAVSPLASRNALKIIVRPDQDDGEDPYSFEMSQTEPENKKKKTKPIKPKKRAGAKAGNQMDLLMQQKALDAAGSSCNVQNNPMTYELEREKLEKQIKIPAPSIATILIKDCAGPSSGVAKISSPINKSPKIVDLTTYSKVWHSPQASVKSVLSNNDNRVERFVSNSPPIQSKFIMKVAGAMHSAQKTHSTSSPYRVIGKFPSTFYFHSSIDGTPSLSSDTVVNQKRKSLSNDQTTQSPVSATTSDASSIKKTIISPPSFLGDSNAENMEPAGFVKSPTKTIRNILGPRSPLKAMALSTLREGEVSSFSVLNVTEQIVVGLAKKAAVDESLDFGQDESESRDQFGFDELIAGKDCQVGQLKTSVNASGPSDIRERLVDMKRYLPSNNNKDRVKKVFPTSPLKDMNLMNSPKKATTSVRSFFTSSTPLLVNGPKKLSIPFDSSETEIKNSTQNDSELEHSKNDLFGDQSELYNVSQL